MQSDPFTETLLVAPENYSAKDIPPAERLSGRGTPNYSTFGSLPSFSLPTFGPKVNVLFHLSLARELGFHLGCEVWGQRWLNAIMIAVQDHTATRIFVERVEWVEFLNLKALLDNMAWFYPTSENIRFLYILFAHSSMLLLVNGIKVILEKESTIFLCHLPSLPRV